MAPPEHPGHKRAARYVEALMGDAGLSRRDLARRSKIDPGTLADFLDAVRWPHAVTRSKIEKALELEGGEIQRRADEETTVGTGAQDGGYVSRGRSNIDDEKQLAAKLDQRQRLDSEIADLVARLHARGPDHR